MDFQLFIRQDAWMIQRLCGQWIDFTMGFDHPRRESEDTLLLERCKLNRNYTPEN